MIVAESQRVRRIVGRLDSGSDLLEALARVCRERQVHSGEVRATGVVDEVELAEFDLRARAYVAPHHFHSAFTIVHMGGSIGDLDGKLHLQAMCALSRQGENGIELLGGRLGRARAVAVDFVIESYDDVLLHRSIDPDTGLLALREAVSLAAPLVPAKPAPAEATPAPRALSFEASAQGRVTERMAPVTEVMQPIAAPAAVVAPTWADVARASTDHDAVPTAFVGREASGAAAMAAAAAAAADDSADDGLRAGDVIEHPRFGRCDVERIEGASDYAQVRLRNKRLIRLSLDVIRLIRDGVDEGGNRKYRVVVER